jgi:hypothetical protein
MCPIHARKTLWATERLTGPAQAAAHCQIRENLKQYTHGSHPFPHPSMHGIASRQTISLMFCTSWSKE